MKTLISMARDEFAAASTYFTLPLLGKFFDNRFLLLEFVNGEGTTLYASL